MTLCLCPRFALVLLAILFPASLLAAHWQVSLPADDSGLDGGRVLLLIEPFTGELKARVSTHAVYPGAVWVAAQDLTSGGAGSTLVMDTAALSWPRPLDQLPPGDYLAQAWLDGDGLYNLDQGGAGDRYSSVRKVTVPLAQDETFALDQTLPAVDLWEFPNAPARILAELESLRPRLVNVELNSTLLSAFHGRDTSLRAWVLLPPDYRAEATRTWPVVYLSGTFGATHKGNIQTASVLDGFGIGRDPSMIWVLLDFWTPEGPSLFADSAVNGPWGRALVEELIPALEARFRMDATAAGRLLTGHSSGGWTSVWLLAHYPEYFGGAWATAPDPLDFTSFLQTDLYGAHANLYYDDRHTLRGVAREDGAVVTTIRDTAQLEAVLGRRGGIFQSWDRVFSPPGPDGAPLPLFDRDTGAVDPRVAAYWREHYDLTYYIRSHWRTLQPAFDGKLHVVVGTEDDHYLEDGVMLLQRTLAELGGTASFTYREGRTHNDLYAIEDDPVGLFRQLAREMFATARDFAQANGSVDPPGYRRHPPQPSSVGAMRIVAIAGAIDASFTPSP